MSLKVSAVLLIFALPQSDNSTVNTTCGEGRIKTFTSVGRNLIVAAFFYFNRSRSSFSYFSISNTQKFQSFDLRSSFICLRTGVLILALLTSGVIVTGCSGDITTIGWSCEVDAMIDDELIWCSYSNDLNDDIFISHDHEKTHGWFLLGTPFIYESKVVRIRLYTTNNDLVEVIDFDCYVKRDLRRLGCDYTVAKSFEYSDLLGYNLLVSE